MTAEFDAVKALFDSVPVLTGRVKDTVLDRIGEVVRDNYLVVYGAGPETLGDGRYGSIPSGDSDATYEFPCKAVGTDPEAVRVILAAVRSVVGVKPAIVGRRADPLEVDFMSVKTDTSVSPPLYFSDFYASVTSRRA